MGIIRRKINSIIDKICERLMNHLEPRLTSQLAESASQMKDQLCHMKEQMSQLMDQTRKIPPLMLGVPNSRIYWHSSDGHRIFLDPNDLHITLHVLEHRCWEDHLRVVLLQVLKPGATFIDVGANVGLHTLFASALVGPRGQVHAFEALPHIFETLKLNIEMNGISDYVTAYPLAVGDRTEVRNFANFRSRAAMSGFTVPQERLEYFKESVENVEKQVETISVQTVSLDSLFADQKVDAIKADVEGYETLVLRGAQKIIENNAELTLLLEWDPLLTASNMGNDAIRENIEYLKAQGFIPHLALWQKEFRRISWEECETTPGDLVLNRNALV